MVRLEELGLYGIGMEPSFAIGQRALLVTHPNGNVMWDYGDKITTSFDLHPKNRKTVLGVVIGDSFDESIQSFGHETATSFDFP